MPIYEKFCNAFIYSWNKNINEYVKKTDMRFEYDLRVVYRKEGIMKEVPQFSDDAIKCFYAAFNGSVCDSEHWEYFKKCFNYVYQKNGFIQDYEKNYSTFREYWNEHIDEFNESLIDRYKGTHIIVVRNKELLMYNLSQTALQCFYKVFNGKVCDIDHWNYFTRCLEDAEKISKIYTENFFFVKFVKNLN